MTLIHTKNDKKMIPQNEYDALEAKFNALHARFNSLVKKFEENVRTIKCYEGIMNIGQGRNTTSASPSSVTPSSVTPSSVTPVTHDADSIEEKILELKKLGTSNKGIARQLNTNPMKVARTLIKYTA